MAVMSFGRAITWLAERDPDRVAIVHEEHSITRSALEQRANRLARAYRELGDAPGDLVTIALPNCIEFFEASLAAWKLGATPQPVSSRLPAPERRAIAPECIPANPSRELETFPSKATPRTATLTRHLYSTALANASAQARRGRSRART